MFNSCRMSRKPPSLSYIHKIERKSKLSWLSNSFHCWNSKSSSSSLSSQCYADNEIRNELIEISFQLKFIQNNFMMSFHCDWNFSQLRFAVVFFLLSFLKLSAAIPTYWFCNIYLTWVIFLSYVIRRFLQEWWYGTMAQYARRKTKRWNPKSGFFSNFQRHSSLTLFAL